MPGPRSRPRPRTPLSTAEEHAAVYAAVVASALDAVIVADEDGRVVSLNPAAVELFGYTPHEAVGHDIGALIVPDHLRSAHRHGMRRYRETREPHVLGRRVEMEARHKDGRSIPVELAITEVVLPGRRLFTANLRDLTAARAAAAEIARQREALHQSEKLAALGTLLAGVAHELNNPLSIVLGHATVLREELERNGGDADPRARARKVEDAAIRCARSVRAYLAAARQQTCDPQVMDVGKTIGDAVDLLEHPLRTAGIGVTRPRDALPKVFADPDQVQQIVVNLLVNALHALSAAPQPRAITIAAEADGAMLQLRVSDSGAGIPPDIAARIFEPFFTTKPQGVGTGIGLSVSRGLAEAQGGDLALLPGSPGATFVLALPLARQPGDSVDG